MIIQLESERLPKNNFKIKYKETKYTREKHAPQYVNIAEFYQQIQHYFQPHSIGFDDACVAYRDRQFVLNRPSKYIRFFSSQDSSAMGGIFGMLVGAKLSNTNLHCFGFTGDGCWRLFSGAMPEAANIGVVLFLFNNQGYGLVKNYIDKINEQQIYHDHSQLVNVDFVSAAKACGWQAYQLKSDLSNLEEIMKKANQTKK